MSALIEVELKAWVDDPEAMEAKLQQAAEFKDEVHYADTYFTYAHTTGYQHQRFRLRESAGRAKVTAKVPLFAHLPGANREHEFEVSDPQAFQAFCQAFGFRVLIRKEKHARRFRPRKALPFPVTIELNQIPGLGCFLEVEALVDDPEKVGAAQALVQSIFQELGVPEAKMEPTPYTRLLYDRGRG
jgi:adenylate cyclase class 2